jgi:hypothetical protein
MKYQGTSNNISSLFVGFVIVSTIFMGTQYAQALVSTDLSKNNNLGNPFLVEHYQTEPNKPNMTNNNISAVFQERE